MYKDGRWHPDAAQIASGEYSEPRYHEGQEDTTRIELMQKGIQALKKELDAERACYKKLLVHARKVENYINGMYAPGSIPPALNELLNKSPIIRLEPQALKEWVHGHPVDKMYGPGGPLNCDSFYSNTSRPKGEE